MPASPKRTPPPSQPKSRPLLSPREDEALRTLRESARIAGQSRRSAPYRPDRSNRYLLPQ